MVNLATQFVKKAWIMGLAVAKAPDGCLGHIFFGRPISEAFATKSIRN
jgi:hypothetical protein